MAPPGGRGGLAGKRSRTGFPVSNLIPFSGYGLKGGLAGCGPKARQATPKTRSTAPNKKTAEHSAEAATCKDKAGFAGKSCADARRQTKGGQLGGSRPHERRLAGPPFRGSVLNVARCCALPPVSCPKSRDAMRRNLRQAKRFPRSAPRCEDHVPRSVRRKIRVVPRLRRAEPLSCANGRALGRTSQVRASRRRRAARGPTPRRNVRNPLVDAPTRALRHSDATAPDTEFPDAATRHEPPDAPRSGTELSDASPSGAERPDVGRSEAFSSPEQAPRRTPCPCRASAAQSRHTPHGLAVQRCPWAPAETALMRLRLSLFCAARKTSSCTDQGSSLTSCRGVPTDRRGKKSAGILSASRRERPEGRSRWTTRGDPPLRAEAAQRRRFRRASGTSSVGSRPQNARNIRRKFHKLFREPSQRLARPNGPATPSRRADTGAQRLPLRASSKNIPAFKLENPSAAEAGDGNESTKEIPYLPSFLRRVRTVSDSSAPLPTQACSFSLSMLRVPGLVLGL